MEGTRRSFDLEAIRADFPILSREVHGKPLVYLDSAASAQKPAQVLDALMSAYQDTYANVHRGLHFLSEASTDLYEAVRGKVAGFIGAASGDEIVLTSGATMSLNLIARCWAQPRLQPGDEILISIAEHHANIVPWQMVAEATGARVRAFTLEDDGAFSMARLKAEMSERTRIISVPHVSNVLGTVFPVAEIAELAHDAGALMEAKLGLARDAGDAMGAQLAAHADASDALASRITAHVTEVGKQLEVLDVSVSASTGVIGRAIEDTKAQLGAFMEEVQSGNGAAHQLIAHSESLLLALDAVTRELDETIPHALDRIVSHGKATQTSLSQLRPLLDASELVAQSTASHVNAVRATLKSNEDQMADHAASQQQLVDRINQSLADAEAVLAKLRNGADEFAKQGGARMIATLDEVRATADSAANEARLTLEKLVSGARDTMQATAANALDAAFKTEIMAQLAAIEDASARAVAAANSAADRLMRQLITIMDTSASVEQRVSEAEQAIAASGRDSLAKQVGVLTEALKSTAIDVTKVLSSEVSDTAWDAYLKGDRGVFARRAVKLIENGEAREILRLYQADDAFHASVNQFIHDFEAMLRLLIGARDGSAISVTLLSSDIGKLYVALAQAIDRLRN